jgi:hypothetical protein
MQKLPECTLPRDPAPPRRLYSSPSARQFHETGWEQPGAGDLEREQRQEQTCSVSGKGAREWRSVGVSLSRVPSPAEMGSPAKSTLSAFYRPGPRPLEQRVPRAASTESTVGEIRADKAGDDLGFRLRRTRCLSLALSQVFLSIDFDQNGQKILTRTASEEGARHAGGSGDGWTQAWQGSIS